MKYMHRYVYVCFCLSVNVCFYLRTRAHGCINILLTRLRVNKYFSPIIYFVLFFFHRSSWNECVKQTNSIWTCRQNYRPTFDFIVLLCKTKIGNPKLFKETETAAESSISKLITIIYSTEIGAQNSPVYYEMFMVRERKNQ